MTYRSILFQSSTIHTFLALHHIKLNILAITHTPQVFVWVVLCDGRLVHKHIFQCVISTTDINLLVISTKNLPSSHINSAYHFLFLVPMTENYSIQVKNVSSKYFLFWWCTFSFSVVYCIICIQERYWMDIALSFFRICFNERRHDLLNFYFWYVYSTHHKNRESDGVISCHLLPLQQLTTSLCCNKSFGFLFFKPFPDVQ